MSEKSQKLPLGPLPRADVRWPGLMAMNDPDRTAERRKGQGQIRRQGDRGASWKVRPSDPLTAESAGGGAYMEVAGAPKGRPCAARKGGEHMTRKTRLVAAFAVGAGLTAAGVAVAQAQTGSAAPRAASAQPAPPPAQSTPPTIQPLDPNAGQPSYSQDPPPDSSSGIYLPAVILGYARSAAGCVVIGCDDGPRVGGSEPSSSGSAEPLPVTPGPYIPR